jgi:anhydro-N-acetylmuramic acid kinase
METLELIGLMSGTSLDGLDIAHVQFDFSEKIVQYELVNHDHQPYPEELKNSLLNFSHSNIASLYILDKTLGKFYADSVNQFVQKNKLNKRAIHAIANHGQTILHQPQNGFTLQIGCGETLSTLTGMTVIDNFRTKDIVLGGQGAPLVPIGDFELFKDKADTFLNIGGFCNISFEEKDQIKAFDICPGNLPLNKLVQSKGLEYDKDGQLASQGEINFFLLDLLNSLEYYALEGPKSLGTEWLEEHFYPLLKFDKDIESNLRTVIEHIAIQVSTFLNEKSIKSIFVSGGGIKNKYLIERIQSYFNGEIIIPDDNIINYKEAIIFAYLGAKYLRRENNIISSVTGASRSSIGGVLHLP